MKRKKILFKQRCGSTHYIFQNYPEQTRNSIFRFRSITNLVRSISISFCLFNASLPTTNSTRSAVAAATLETLFRASSQALVHRWVHKCVFLGMDVPSRFPRQLQSHHQQLTSCVSNPRAKTHRNTVRSLERETAFGVAKLRQMKFNLGSSSSSAAAAEVSAARIPRSTTCESHVWHLVIPTRHVSKDEPYTKCRRPRRSATTTATASV